MDSNLQSSLNLAFVEGLYSEYLRDPNGVSADGRAYCESQLSK